MPRALAEEPQLTEFEELYYRIFSFLSQRRKEANPIEITEMIAYADVLGEKDKIFFLDLMGFIDSLFLKDALQFLEEQRKNGDGD